MNIKRIIVDELPENCSECWFFERVEGCRKDKNFCTAIDREDNDIPDPYDGRMSWCPLVVEDECEWKGKHRRIGKPDEHFEYKSPHEEPHYHTDFPNAVNGGVYDTKIYTYCHVCGKRIKYVESEE